MIPALIPTLPLASGGPTGPSFLLRANFNAANQTFSDQQVLKIQNTGVQDGILTASITSGNTVQILGNKLDMTRTAGDAGVASGPYPCDKPRGVHFTFVPSTNQGFPGFLSTVPYGTTGLDGTYQGYWVLGGNLYAFDAVRGVQPPLSVAAPAGTTFEGMHIYGGANETSVPWDGTSFDLYPFGQFFFVWDGSALEWRLEYFLDHHSVSYYSGRRDTSLSADILQGGASPAQATGLIIYDRDFTSAVTPVFRSISVALNNTYTGLADQLFLFKVTLPSAGNIDVDFRRVSDNERWTIRIAANGSMDLRETTGGTPTSRGTAAAGTIVNGSIILVSMLDTIVRVNASNWNSNILYSTAASNKTATGLKIFDLGTGGALTWIVGYRKHGFGSAMPNPMSAQPFTSASNPVSGSFTKQLSIDGDSLIDGDGFNRAGVQTYLKSILGGSWQVSNHAVGGSHLADLITRQAAVNADFNAGNARNELIIWIGTSEGGSGTIASTAAANVQSYLTTMLGTWGAGHITFLAMLDRKQSGLTWNPDMVTFRTQYNANMQTWCASNGVRFLDVTQSGQMTDSNDLTYFRDDPTGVHLNYYGEGLVARKLFDLIGR